MAVKLSNLAANTEADALLALANSGYLDIYDGTRPATPDTAVTTQVLLASPRFGNPAFAAAVNGVATAHAVTSDFDADASGTASWFRVTKSDHATVLFDGSVGTSGTDVVLDTASIVAHGVVAVGSLTYTVPKS